MGEPIRDGDFWKGPLEAALYLEIVHRNPRREGETPLAYIVRISETVQAEQASDAELRAQAIQQQRNTLDQRDPANW